MLIPLLTTKAIPQTLSILKRRLPTIFLSKCFNDNKYSFLREAKNTEIAHLFEHILLEYLGILKRGNGRVRYVHNGVTWWNWVEEARGVFHISIDVGEGDKMYFEIALQKSLDLLSEMIDSSIASTPTEPRHLSQVLERETVEDLR